MSDLKRRPLRDKSPYGNSAQSQSASPKMPRKVAQGVSPRMQRKGQSPQAEGKGQGQKDKGLYPNLGDSNNAAADGGPDVEMHPSNLYPRLDRGTDDEGLQTEESGTDSADVRDSPDGKKTSAKRRAKGARKVDKNVPQYSSADVSDEEISQTDSTDSNSFPSMIVIAACVVVASIAVVLVYRYSTEASSNLGAPESTTTAAPMIDFYLKFKPGFDNLKNQYSSQTKRFWRVIGTSIKRLLTEADPTYPAIILMGVPKGQAMTASCIAKDLVSEVNAVYNTMSNIYINSSNLDQVTPAKTKLDLDNRLRRTLDVSKGVVLDHIEILPADAALLLHAYCDGDNAPYKSAVIVLVLNTDLEHSDMDDKVMEQILNSQWEEELGLDEMPALRSRIANNIAILQPEVSVTCD